MLTDFKGKTLCVNQLKLNKICIIKIINKEYYNLNT